MKKLLQSTGVWMRIVIKDIRIPTLENQIDTYKNGSISMNRKIKKIFSEIKNTIEVISDSCGYSIENIFISPISINCIYGAFISELENPPTIEDWRIKYFPGIIVDDFNKFILASINTEDLRIKNLINLMIEKGFEIYCINNLDDFFSHLIICDGTTKRIIGTK